MTPSETFGVTSNCKGINLNVRNGKKLVFGENLNNSEYSLVPVVPSRLPPSNPVLHRRTML